MVTYEAGCLASSPDAISSAWVYLFGNRSVALMDNDVSITIAIALSGGDMIDLI
jgi:hypothetical protein